MEDIENGRTQTIPDHLQSGKKSDLQNRLIEMLTMVKVILLINHIWKIQFPIICPPKKVLKKKIMQRLDQLENVKVHHDEVKI